MRSELVALVALGGCMLTDPARPIGLVARDLSETDATSLASAARCWNLEFGTRLVVGDEARPVEQQVDVFYDRFTCLSAEGRVQGGWPASLALCDERYRTYDRDTSPADTSFRVLSHELGHLLNIVGHPDDDSAVMGSGGAITQPMFRPVDLERFDDANPGFTSTSSCTRVVRVSREGAGGRPVERCACEGEADAFDLDRSIAVVPPASFSAIMTDQLAAAAACWNLRYGTQITVGASAPDAQTAYVERTSGRCWLLGPGKRSCRFQEDDAAYVYIDQSVINSAPSAMWQRAIGRVIGVDVGLLDPDTETAFAARFPGHPVRCRTLMVDGAGACTCGDPP